jgi:hypothetical protein
VRITFDLPIVRPESVESFSPQEDCKVHSHDTPRYLPPFYDPFLIHLDAGLVHRRDQSPCIDRRTDAVDPKILHHQEAPRTRNQCLGGGFLMCRSLRQSHGGRPIGGAGGDEALLVITETVETFITVLCSRNAALPSFRSPCSARKDGAPSARLIQASMTRPSRMLVHYGIEKPPMKPAPLPPSIWNVSP